MQGNAKDSVLAMSAHQQSVVILGAGHAGGSAAFLLRQFGWCGAITLIGNEACLPYHRPPLSKSWLKGEVELSSLAIRPSKLYVDQNIKVSLKTQVLKIDRCGKRVILSDGSEVPYDKLIIALGARPRTLSIPGISLGGVFELRSLCDADRLRDALCPGATLAVIGGGYVGLETAASAKSLGVHTVVIERETRVLARVASEALSRFVERQHRARGVTLELGSMVQALEGKNGQVVAVRLIDGRAIRTDTVLIAVGAKANDELARHAGFLCEDGVVVDQEAKTSDADVYAIGDCSLRKLPYDGRTARFESISNANEQAKQAAASICRRPPPKVEVPWFWSDQFDLKLQMAGLPDCADECVVRGSTSNARIAVFYLSPDRRITSVETVNAPAEFMAGKSFISKALPIVEARLCDPSVSMSDIAA